MRFDYWASLFSQKETDLFRLNSDAVKTVNYSILCVLSFITSLLMMMLTGTTFTPVSDSEYRALYVPFLFFFLAVYALVRYLPAAKKQPLPLFYIYSSGLIAFAVILSTRASHSKFPAVTFTCLQAIMPMLILDRTYHVTSFFIFTFFIHSICSYFCKPETLFISDLINGGTFTIAGIVLGDVLRKVQVSNLDANRNLTIQRNTDALTGLLNRRVLFEQLAAAAGPLAEKPVTGAFMIDIDFFKKYNDTFGHQAGDECLRKLGSCFSEFGKANGFTFYRYGGEEFIALSSSIDPDDVAGKAEELRTAAKNLNIAYPEQPSGHMTMSIGYAGFADSSSMPYEEMIRHADTALYKAKAAGHDCVQGSVFAKSETLHYNDTYAAEY